MLKPGNKFRFKILKNLENDSVIIHLDPSATLPIREHGKLGGGGTAFRRTDGKVLFYFVVQNTPFRKAGIEDGMELIAINGKAVSDLTYDEITNFLLQPRETTLVLKIKNILGNESEIKVVY